MYLQSVCAAHLIIQPSCEYSFHQLLCSLSVAKEKCAVKMDEKNNCAYLLKQLEFLFSCSKTWRCIGQCFIKSIMCFVIGHIKSHPNFHEFMYKQNVSCGQLTQYISCSRQLFWYCSDIHGSEVYVPPHNRGQYGCSY